jgi:hypothetical protein
MPVKRASIWLVYGIDLEGWLIRGFAYILAVRIGGLRLTSYAKPIARLGINTTETKEPRLKMAQKPLKKPRGVAF